MQSRSQEIEEMLAALGHVWRRTPHLRPVQHFANLVDPTQPFPKIFFIEDAELAVRMRRTVTPR